jgi:membrane-associated phospholipid phosphatase
LLAVAVAYSRVHTGVHYPGDVVAGSLIGITAGEIASRVVGIAVNRMGSDSAVA